MTEGATPVFSCPAGLYVRQGLRRLAVRLALPALVVAGVLAVLAFSDLRFGYLLLVVVLVVYPMAWSLLWIGMTGRPWFTLATRPQRWKESPGRAGALTVEFFRFGCDRENPGQPVLSVIFSKADIEQTYRSKGYIVMRTRDSRCPLLIAPEAVFQNH